MVWREMRPAPLTDDQITAVYEGREMVAEFNLPPVRLLCWHFGVKNDGDYWIVGFVHLGNVGTKVFRSIADADAAMRRMISFVTMTVMNNEPIITVHLEAQLSMDNDDAENHID